METVIASVMYLATKGWIYVVPCVNSGTRFPQSDRIHQTTLRVPVFSRRSTMQRLAKGGKKPKVAYKFKLSIPCVHLSESK